MAFGGRSPIKDPHEWRRVDHRGRTSPLSAEDLVHEWNDSNNITISNSPIKDQLIGANDHPSVQELGVQAIEGIKQLKEMFTRGLSEGDSGDNAPSIVKPAQNGPKASSTPKFFSQTTSISTLGAPSLSPRKAEKRGAGNLSSDDLSPNDNIKRQKQQTNHLDPSSEQQPPKPTNPPDLVLKDRAYYPRIESHIKSIHLKGKIEAIVKGSSLAIRSTNLTDYYKLKQYLTDQDFHYYTYKLDSDKTRRYVIRGIVPELDTEDIKADLVSQGFHPVDVRFKTKLKNGVPTPMPLCLVELKDTPESREILKVTRVMHQVVKLEREHYTGPPVCGRCLAYNHSKFGCNITPGCLFCIHDHPPGQCKGDPTKPECRKCADKYGVDCKQRLGHKPTYKGCPAYQAFCKKKGIQTVKPKDGKQQFRPAPPPGKVAWQSPLVVDQASPQSTPKRPPADRRSRFNQRSTQPPSNQSNHRTTQPPSSQSNQPSSAQSNHSAQSTQQHSNPNPNRKQQTNTNKKHQKQSKQSNQEEDEQEDKFDLKFFINIFRKILKIVKIYKTKGFLAAFEAAIPLLDELNLE